MEIYVFCFQSISFPLPYKELAFVHSNHVVLITGSIYSAFAFSLSLSLSLSLSRILAPL